MDVLSKIDSSSHGTRSNNTVEASVRHKRRRMLSSLRARTDRLETARQYALKHL